MGKQWKQWQTLFSWAPKSLQMVTSAMKLKDACFLEEKLWASRQHIKKQRHYFADNGPSSQSYDFSSSHLSMWELGHKESWALKNWCFWTALLEKTLESPLGYKEIQPVHLKGNYSWIFIERTDAEAEVPILWPPDVKNRLMEKTLMLGKVEGGKRRGQQRIRWLDWHHWLDGHEFEQALGVGDGQGGLACCRPRGRKELDTTERLNWSCCLVTKLCPTLLQPQGL